MTHAKRIGLLFLAFSTNFLAATSFQDFLGSLSKFSGQEGAVRELQRQPTPVVLWHGMGDDCCHAFSMGAIKKLIEKEIPGVYVLSLCIGNNPDDVAQCNQVADTMNGFLGDVNSQIDYACSVVSQDENLSEGYHIVGFSQGGLFSRVLAQRCTNGPTVKSLVSIGGPQNGVNSFPNCAPDGPREICEYVSKLLDVGAYVPAIQARVVQAQYWHDPLHPDTYKTKNIFLADANQENDVVATEVSAIKNLEAMVLVKFTEDTMVLPRESEWFGFYETGNVKNTLPAKELPIWENLGLGYLSDKGRLHFLSTVGEHLQFTNEWFIENIVPFLTG